MDRIPLSISLAPAGGIRGRKIYISSKKAISLGLTNSGLWDAGPSTPIMQAISNLISESNRKKKNISGNRDIQCHELQDALRSE